LVILDVQYATVDLVVTALSGNGRMQYLWADFEMKQNAMESLEASKWDAEELQRLAQWCQEGVYPGVSIQEKLDGLREEAEGSRKWLAVGSEMDWSE
jgi:hypothetical protein